MATLTTRTTITTFENLSFVRDDSQTLEIGLIVPALSTLKASKENPFEDVNFHIGLLIHSSCTLNCFFLSRHASCHVVLHQKLLDRVHHASKEKISLSCYFVLVAWMSRFLTLSVWYLNNAELSKNWLAINGCQIYFNIACYSSTWVALKRSFRQGPVQSYIHILWGLTKAWSMKAGLEVSFLPLLGCRPPSYFWSLTVPSVPCMFVSRPIQFFSINDSQPLLHRVARHASLRGCRLAFFIS